MAEVPSLPKNIQVLEISSSKKSIIIDRGNLEGIKIHDKAKFILQVGEDRPKLYTVAYGEVVKVQGNYSIWHLGRIENDEFLFQNAQLLFLPMKDVFSGRSDFRIKQEKIILAPGRPEDALNKNVIGQKKSLIKAEENYKASDSLVETTPSRNHHLETKDFGQWKKNPSKTSGWNDEYRAILEGLTIEELETVVEANLVRKLNDQWVMQSVTEGVQDKYNKEEMGLKKIYHDQKRDPNDKTMQAKSSIKTVFDDFKDSKKKEALLDERAIGKIKKDTAFWSGDMSDLELQEFFHKSQLSKEVKRRQRGLSHRSGHELLIKFDKGLNDTTDDRDPSNQRTSASFDIGYEFHLIRVGDFFKKFSVDLFYMMGRNYYDVGAINAHGEEKSFQMGLNYYLYNEPTSLEDFMLFVGGAYRSGRSLLDASTLSQKYLYSLTSLPIVYSGIKYRLDLSDSYNSFLKVGVAFVGLLSFEPIILRSAETISDNINGTIQSNQLKLTLGMSVMF